MKFNKKKYFYYFVFCIFIFTIFIYGGFFENFSTKIMNKLEASVINVDSIEEIQEETILKENTEIEESIKEDSVISSFETKENSILVSNSMDNNSLENDNAYGSVTTNNDNYIGNTTTNNNIINNSTSLENELDIIKKDTNILGTYGRIFVPSVDLDVALYLADMTSNNVQKVVDDRDSAAYFDFNNQNVIADHNHQGFHKIIDMSIGDFAYIKKTDGSIDTYQMTDKFEGENIVYDLVDLSGNSVLNGKSSLVMYTCYKMSEYDNHVMITIFQLVR